MAILYGDLTPSPLTFDYLDYLRRALAMSVEVLLAEDQLAGAGRRRRALQARSQELQGRIEGLQRTVHEAIGETARSPKDDPVTHCAIRIESAVEEVVARSVAQTRAQDEATAAEIGTRERKSHAACVDAVEGFLRVFDFPESSHEIVLEPTASGHLVTLRASTPYHVVSEMELDLRESPFAAAEVRAGSLTKARLADVKLDKLLVLHARCDPREIELRLRAGRERGAEGVDVTVARGGGNAHASRVRRLGAAEPMSLSSDDERTLAALASAIAAALDGRVARRTKLRGVTVDDVPLDEHERPSQLVDRVLGAMGPQVRAIVERSQVPGELSLRMELGGGRREEIFLAHGKLLEMVAQVPVARRRHFEVLGLPGMASVRAPTDADVEIIMESAELPALSDPSISIQHEE